MDQAPPQFIQPPMNFSGFPLKSNDYGRTLNSLVSKYLKIIPSLKKEINDSKYIKKSKIGKIINEGFNSIKQSTNIMNIKEMNDNKFNDFLNYLHSQIDLPQFFKDKFNPIIKDILLSSSDEWLLFKVMFSVDKNCKYVSILAQHDEEKEVVNWLIANIESKFTLESELLVINEAKSFSGELFEKSQKRVSQIPNSLVESQISILEKFFDVIVFEKFGEILNISSDSISQPDASNRNLYFLK